MLRAAQADALGAEVPRGAGVDRRFRVRADPETPLFVRPTHQGCEVARQFRLDGRHLAVDDLARGAIDGDPVAGRERATADAHLCAVVIDVDLAGAGNTGPPHAAGHHGCVAGHAAAGRQDAARGVHAVNVFRAGLDPHQDHVLALARHVFRQVRVEDNPPRRGARRCRQPLAEHLARRIGIEPRVQQLIELPRLDAQDRVGLADQPVIRHFHGDPHRRGRGALPGPGLQHVELVALHGELDVLHVLVVRLQGLADLGQLREHLGHDLFHGRQVRAVPFLARDGQVLRRADTGDHVLALRVHQILAVEDILAGRRIAGERHAGRAVVAHVAEHHRLHVDGGAPLGRDVLQPAVGDGALVHPRAEDGADRAPELLARILGERCVELAHDDRLVFADDGLPVLGRKVGVEDQAVVELVLFQHLLEDVVIDAEHHVGIHLDEAAVAVEGEARIARTLGEPGDGHIVQTEVQHRVHHARHGRTRA